MIPHIPTLGEPDNLCLQLHVFYAYYFGGRYRHVTVYSLRAERYKRMN